jgi:hypothetical protein
VARTELNGALKSIHGRIDSWVYRRIRGRIVISRRPIASGAVSQAQALVRERFRVAGEYAKATLLDPVQRAFYQTISEQRNQPIVSVMLTDFLKPPVVDELDLTAYRGLAGDVIRIRATDDVEVRSVGVVIQARNGTVLEKGDAVLQSGVWTYLSSTQRTRDELAMITATALDRPGHVGTRVVQWPGAD